MNKSLIDKLGIMNSKF